MKKNKICALAFCCLSVGMRFARAEDPTVAANREKWNKMSEDEKNRIRSSFRHFQEMGPVRKARLLETYRRFKAEHPERLEKMIGIYTRYLKLTPAEQKTFLENVRKRRGWSAEEVETKRRRLERRYELYQEDNKSQSSAASGQ